MKQKSFAALICCALTAGAMAGTPLAAQAQTSTTKVTYDDLDLTTDAGQKKLHSRINYAVQNVCAASGRLTLAESQHVRRCKKAAAGNAGRQAEVAIARANDGQRFAERDVQIVVGN